MRRFLGTTARPQLKKALTPLAILFILVSLFILLIGEVLFILVSLFIIREVGLNGIQGVQLRFSGRAMCIIR